jgi:hypothetical protein
LTVDRKKFHVSQRSLISVSMIQKWSISCHQHLREGYLRTLAGLGGRVATVGTGGLLDVERPLAYSRRNITG